MPKGDVVVAMVIDRSGSMDPIREQTIQGFNEFKNELAKQKGKSWITAVQFDSPGNSPEISVVIDGSPVSQIPDWTAQDYQPRGGTPLFDAVIKTGEHLDNTIAALQLANEFDADTKVLFVIMTDGHENASKASLSDVQEFIKGRESTGWDFLFLGAGLQDFSQSTFMAQTSGQHVSSVNFATTSSKAAYVNTAGAVANYRTTGAAGRTAALRTLTDQVAATTAGSTIWENPDASTEEDPPASGDEDGSVD